MESFWNERYAAGAYVYGEAPNEYYKARLAGLTPGRALFPADGEGRNSVYAAEQGWEAFAFDYAATGREKALALAARRGVSIAYTVSDFATVSFPEAFFDLVVFSYGHYPPDLRAGFHQKAVSWLKPGGHVILEAFSPEQLNYQEKHRSGGPRDREMLYSAELLRGDFAELEMLELLEAEVMLREGPFHEGLAHVVRLFGRK